MIDQTLDDWLHDLAARQPTPGGGGAAALAAATAAALVSMVAKYTSGPRFADVEEQAKDIDAEADTLRTTALELIDLDAKAFAAVGAAYGLPKDTESEAEARREQIDVALIGAAGPPRRVAALAVQIIGLAERLLPIGNRNVLSDVGVAASMAAAALDSAIINVEVNRVLIADTATQQELVAEVEPLRAGRGRAMAVVEAVSAAITSS